MSCVCILTPVVIAAWPAFSAAVVAASASRGPVAAEAADFAKNAVAKKSSNKVQLEIENSEVVTNQLGREQRIAVTRDGRDDHVFARRARQGGALRDGQRPEDEALRALGEEMSQCVVQKYVFIKS